MSVYAQCEFSICGLAAFNIHTSTHLTPTHCSQGSASPFLHIASPESMPPSLADTIRVHCVLCDLIIHAAIFSIATVYSTCKQLMTGSHARHWLLLTMGVCVKMYMCVREVYIRACTSVLYYSTIDGNVGLIRGVANFSPLKLVHGFYM